MQSGVGFILSLIRKLWSILRGKEKGGMISDFKIFLSTTYFDKLPLQTSKILAFTENPRSEITSSRCSKTFITY